MFLPSCRLPQGESEGEGEDERPVWRHDIDFVDAKAQDEVDEQVEGEEGERHPEQATPPSAPDSDEKQQDDDSFHHIVIQMSVAHDDGTGAQRVF